MPDPELTNTEGSNIDTPEEVLAWKTALGLENLDNTSDADKPVSGPQAAAMQPIELLTTAERKNASNYSSPHPTPWLTRVITADKPGILWLLTDADVTADASWIGMPYTVDPDGDIIVSMELADVSGTVPDANVLGQVGGRPTIGDSVTTGGKSLVFKDELGQGNPPGMARFVSIKDTNIAITVKSTTGYVAARKWDGTVAVYGSGTPSSFIPISLTVPASGAWSKSAPKDFFVWSCTAGDATQSGDLTYIQAYSNNLTSVDVVGLTELTHLYCDRNNLTSLDVSGLSALTFLSCHTNNLTTLEVGGLTSLVTLWCYTCNLAVLDVSGLDSLVALRCDDNNLTTIDVAGLTSLVSLDCSGNNLATFNASGAPALDYLKLQDNQLTSILMDGAILSYGGYHGGNDISGNLLDGAALDAFYTSLGEDVGATGIIDVSGNPGTTTDDPTIATAKGYTITGT